MTSSFLVTINFDLLINWAEKLPQGKKKNKDHIVSLGCYLPSGPEHFFERHRLLWLQSRCTSDFPLSDEGQLWIGHEVVAAKLDTSYKITLVCMSPDFILISIFSQVFTQLWRVLTGSFFSTDRALEISHPTISDVISRWKRKNKKRLLL